MGNGYPGRVPTSLRRSTGSPAVKSPIDEAIRLPPTQPREVSIDPAVRAGVTGPLDHSMRESAWRGVGRASTPRDEDARLLRNYEGGP